jgi:hypothetical protein
VHAFVCVRVRVQRAGVTCGFYKGDTGRERADHVEVGPGGSASDRKGLGFRAEADNLQGQE